MGKGGGGGGSPSHTTTTVKQDQQPWEGQKPYLERVFSEAEGLYDEGGPQYYPGQTLAPASPYSQESIASAAARAQAGSPVQRAAMENAGATIRGDYLNSNPYLDQTYNRAADQVEARMRGAWGGQDTMTGSSGLQQAALGTALSDLATSVYGGNYERERQRQATMAALGPTLAESDYNDITRLSMAGDAARGLEQQDINDAIQRYNYEQNLPYLNLQNFGQMVSGDYGGSGTQTSMQPYFRSPLSNPIAGAGIGGLLGYGMTNSGYGALGGAALGGLMGGK